MLSSKREIRDPFESVAEPQPVDMKTVYAIEVECSDMV